MLSYEPTLPTLVLGGNYYLHYLSADFTSQQMQNAVHWISMHKLCTITVSMAYILVQQYRKPQR